MNTQQRSAFTLVELLTVVVIITILASLSMVALTGSMQTAKEIKTYGTIQKLDAAILPIFESYEQRFEYILDESNYEANVHRLNDRQIMRLKLHLIHDLMRMEMPSHWPEVLNISSGNRAGPISITLNGQAFSVNEPPVFRLYYQSQRTAVNNHPNATFSEGAAELLFLIIANRNPEALEGFGGTEIADTDNNGLMEFVDAWGKPIYFLRAAPGFTGTDRQPDIVHLAGLTLGVNSTVNASLWVADQNPDNLNENDWSDTSQPILHAYHEAIARWTDPFDPGRVVGRSWFLYPVIVSAGPDGIFDLALGRLDGSGLLSPTRFDHVNPFNFPTGIPEDKTDAPGALNHYDNIHNHRQSGGF